MCDIVYKLYPTSFGKCFGNTEPKTLIDDTKRHFYVCETSQTLSNQYPTYLTLDSCQNQLGRVTVHDINQTDTYKTFNICEGVDPKIYSLQASMTPSCAIGTSSFWIDNKSFIPNNECVGICIPAHGYTICAKK